MPILSIPATTLPFWRGDVRGSASSASGRGRQLTPQTDRRSAATQVGNQGGRPGGGGQTGQTTDGRSWGSKELAAAGPAAAVGSDEGGGLEAAAGRGGGRGDGEERRSERSVIAALSRFAPAEASLPPHRHGEALREPFGSPGGVSPACSGGVSCVCGVVGRPPTVRGGVWQQPRRRIFSFFILRSAPLFISRAPRYYSA